jgi:hypothetical protein
MNATTGRVLMALVVAVSLIGLGVLEVLSERVRVDGAFTTLYPAAVEREPAWDTLAPPDATDPALDPSRLAMSLQMGRLTVVTVDDQAHRLLSVNGTGRVVISDVPDAAVVVTEDRGAARLALLRAGDVIRIEPAGGPIQKIVLLRHGWQEMESPEQ